MTQFDSDNPAEATISYASNEADSGRQYPGLKVAMSLLNLGMFISLIIAALALIGAFIGLISGGMGRAMPALGIVLVCLSYALSMFISKSVIECFRDIGINSHKQSENVRQQTMLLQRIDEQLRGGRGL